MLNSKFFSLSLALVLATTAAAASAAPLKNRKPATSKAVKFAGVLADKRNGNVYDLKNKKSPFLIYRSLKDAKKEGFKPLNNSLKSDFSGWYRGDLRVKRNTCDNQLTSSGPALFLQVKEKSGAVFAEFCPSFGSYSGVRTENGILLTSEETRRQDPDESICHDGRVKVNTIIEISRVVEGASAYNIKMKEIISCTSYSSGANSCTREMEGPAFLETTHHWPDVSDNVHDMARGCGTALQNCSDCHKGLDTSKIVP